MFRILTVLLGLCLGLTVVCLSPRVFSSEQDPPVNNPDALDISEIASTSLSLSTYLGGGGQDTIRDIATDILGNIYITGGTGSSSFPVTPGSFDSSFNGVHDVFVAKISPSGALVWATFIGGPNYDRAYALEVDSLGSVYVAGRAGQGFPTTAGALQRTFAGDVVPNAVYGDQDGFIAKLSADGSRLIWSTYFGSDGRDFIRDLSVDASGSVYVGVSDVTRSHPHVKPGAFQTTRRGPSDGMVAKISSNGSSVVWGSYFGGSGDDGGTPSTRVDATGNLYYLTHSTSTDAPVTAGAFKRTFSGGSGSDLMLARIASDGTRLVFSTYFGGTASDFTETHGLAIDAGGNAYIAFTTRSTSLPTTVGAFQRTYGGSGGSASGGGTNYAGDVFVAKVSGDGRQLLAGTYLGGRHGEGAEGITVDPQGNVYVSGATYSDNFPVTTGAFQSSIAGDADLFAVKLTGDLRQVSLSTYIGGSNTDYGRASTVDSNGVFYVAGQSESSNWPISNPIQPSYRGAIDGVLVKLGQVACQFSLWPLSQSLPAAGGTGSVSVTAQTGCVWTASSSASWISVTSGSSGTGNGTTNYSVTSNTSTNSRTGTVIIAGQTFTVAQAGTVNCSFSISPISQSFNSFGGTGTVQVSAQAGCSWIAISNAAWINVTSGGSGSGNGTVNYSVASNGSTNSRTGSIIIAGRTFSVTQAATVNCSFAISPSSRSVGASGATGSVQLSTQTGCSWTATSNAAWINVTSGSSGTGNGTVNYSVASNTSNNSRTGTVTIGGRTFSVTQAGTLTCSFSISPTSRSFNAIGGTGSIQVSTQGGCSWTATSNAAWIKVTSESSGTGNGTVNYLVASNTSANSRTGTITVAGLTFTVSEAAGIGGCGNSVNPTSSSFGETGGEASVTVIAEGGCSWTAVSNASWITISSPRRRRGNGTVWYSVAFNPSGVPRAGTMTIADRSFTVSQP